MKFTYKAVVFDWAFTLVDLGDENDLPPFKAMHQSMQERGWEAPAFDDFYSRFKTSFRNLIQQSRKSHQEARFEDVLKSFLISHRLPSESDQDLKELMTVYYKKTYERRKVYGDVTPTLEALRQQGIPMGIISNTTNPEFMKAYERSQCGLDAYFNFAVYSSSVPYRKPHPSIFQIAIERLNLPSHEILYVGDNPAADIVGSQSAGMKAVWLNRDNSVLPDSIRPDYEINSLSEILSLNGASIHS
ncbi:MAG: HAD family hydrolase [Candidatus Nitrohelix vancouverensis]|uniref:HAD family hydrolase n=1 Tax=Candidatus Nitrohelix vancouverensis TaxID=2705534 RepID=A0A7T0C3P7_9BACT|nr:MAG: HAD family hydrolase [Candidatus Nitrohelix vancouverensis]